MIEVFKTTLNLEELKVKREKLNARNFEIQLLGGSIGKSDKLIEDVVKLEGLLSNCMEYFSNAYLCYEITETDYIVNQQTYETMNLVNEILNNR